MAEWRIKEISDLTKTSIRMLRHYDKMGLLKPSYRSSNGYRCYNEQDLAKLQQIIALKYFGFKLSTIKAILQKHQNVYAHLQAQQKVLNEQSTHLRQVNSALGDILRRLSPSEAPNWNDLITLIGGYRMTENLRETLKKGWAGKELNESQFEAYLELYENFPREYAEADKIIEQINNNELGEPEGQNGERVVSFYLDLAKKTKALYTKQLKFGSSLLKGIQSGQISQLQLSPEGLLWVSRASLTYWLKRWDALYTSIVENSNTDPAGAIGRKIAKAWIDLVDEHLLTGPRSFTIGTMLWQEMARQDHKLRDLKTMPSPQEMVKEYHIKLFFNPEASTWITRALEAYEK